MTNPHEANHDHPFEAEIDHAIAGGELFFLHQPQVDLTTGNVIGSEALIRWFHRDLGMLSPGAFLPRLASARALDSLTYFAVDSAIAQWKAWEATGVRLPVAVNVTPLVLASEEFPLRVARAVERAAIPAGMLKLEITEETLISDGTRAAEVIGFLGGCGVGFSIDDFGAGYSSLSHLLDFEICEVKIDRSFVEAMPADARARRIVAALTKLARELGITTVGEGVSSATVAESLFASGCTVGQGFHLAMPMPARDIPAFVCGAGSAVQAGAASPSTAPDAHYRNHDPVRDGQHANEQTR
ncbi:MAG: EAL domain-containing protein [Thermoanaerobaculia bacterium]|jgi:EAL domain-containing protein (putative c-di-GMP-specific phosphodiesterase class I)